MPVADDNRSPIDTPSVARSERSIVTTPTTADAAANRNTRFRSGTRPPNASSPTTAAANDSASPTYSRSLPATLPTDGDGVVGTGTLGVTTVPGATLTPKLNAPAVACPSASETTRQLTV